MAGYTPESGSAVNFNAPGTTTDGNSVKWPIGSYPPESGTKTNFNWAAGLFSNFFMFIGIFG